MKFLENFADSAYAALRVMTGFMFSFHGMQLILGVLSQFRPHAGSQLWFGGLIELLCGLAVLLGFKARPAAFLASGTMAVAYVQFHWKFRMGANFFPAINEGELAALYCFVFLYIACRGAGKWSLE